MSETNGRHARHSSFGTGFYIALFLGVTALAVLGYRTLILKTIAAPEQEVSASEELMIPIEKIPVETAEETVEENTEEPVSAEETADELPVFDASEIEVAPVPPRLIVDPLKGETITVFSVDELLFSETLGDWRTHDGIDIAAEIGTPVLAACSGVVSAVEDDDLMGTCVTILHDGGYETVYANLQATPTVAPGDEVSAGQIIGSVGDTALSESSARPHLHFAVRKDGEAFDPTEFLK